MRVFLTLVGAVAVLPWLNAVMQEVGATNGIEAHVFATHAIELAILIAVCWAGASILGALKEIAGKLDDMTGKPRAPEPPPFGKKDAPPDAAFDEPPPAPKPSNPWKRP